MEKEIIELKEEIERLNVKLQEVEEERDNAIKTRDLFQQCINDVYRKVRYYEMN